MWTDFTDKNDNADKKKKKKDNLSPKTLGQLWNLNRLIGISNMFYTFTNIRKEKEILNSLYIQFSWVL